MQVAVKLIRLDDVDERLLDCLRREVAVLLHTIGECKQVGRQIGTACPHMDNTPKTKWYQISAAAICGSPQQNL